MEVILWVRGVEVSCSGGGFPGVRGVVGFVVGRGEELQGFGAAGRGYGGEVAAEVGDGAGVVSAEHVGVGGETPGVGGLAIVGEGGEDGEGLFGFGDDLVEVGGGGVGGEEDVGEEVVGLEALGAGADGGGGDGEVRRASRRCGRGCGR